jgi:hypothetical protein
VRQAANVSRGGWHAPIPVAVATLGGEEVLVLGRTIGGEFIIAWTTDDGEDIVDAASVPDVQHYRPVFVGKDGCRVVGKEDGP